MRVAASDFNFTGVGPQQSRHNLDRSRLSRAVRAEQPHGFTRENFQRKPLDSGDRPERFSQILSFDGWMIGHIAPMFFSESYQVRFGAVNL
jgi:hypothetical protein